MACMPAASRICGRSPSRSPSARAAIVAVWDCSVRFMLPPPQKAGRLIVLETAGWANTGRLRASLRLRLARAPRACRHSAASTQRRPLGREARARYRRCWSDLQRHHRLGEPLGPAQSRRPDPDGVSERTKATLAKAEAMTVADYRAALVDRETAQQCYAHVGAAGRCRDHALLSRTGAALAGRSSRASRWHRARQAIQCSTFRARCCSRRPLRVPLMAVCGMPVGVQLMGQQHEDARITAMARWLVESVPPVVVD